MRISAKSDYAIRALVLLADAQPQTGSAIAEATGIPRRFLMGILKEMVRAGLVKSRRGTSGGFELAFPPAEISVAQVLRALDGPLLEVVGMPASALDDRSTVNRLWQSLEELADRALTDCSVADVAAGRGLTATAAPSALDDPGQHDPR